MPVSVAAVVWLSCLRVWGVHPAALDDGSPVLEIHRVVRRPIAIVYVVGYHFPAGEHIWLSINEDRGGRFTDCQGEEEWVRADRRGRVSARLLIPRCALHLCDAHTETLGATAHYKWGLDCGRGDVTVFACPR